MFWSDRFIACAPFVPSGALSLLQFFGRNTKGQGRVNVDDFRFLAVTIDRGAKQRIAGAGTATATEATREHKQYAI